MTRSSLWPFRIIPVQLFDVRYWECPAQIRSRRCTTDRRRAVVGPASIPGDTALPITEPDVIAKLPCGSNRSCLVAKYRPMLHWGLPFDEVSIVRWIGFHFFFSFELSLCESA